MNCYIFYCVESHEIASINHFGLLEMEFSYGSTEYVC